MLVRYDVIEQGTPERSMILSSQLDDRAERGNDRPGEQGYCEVGHELIYENARFYSPYINQKGL